MSKDMLDPDVAAINEATGTGVASAEAMVLDLDEINEDAPDFELMPAGTYDCYVDNVEFGNSKAGNPMVTWIFKVLEGDFKGRLLFYHNAVNNDIGKKRLKQALLRIVPDVDLKNFNPQQFADDGVALGAALRVKVKIRPFKNQNTGKSEPRNNVADVLPPAESGDAFLDDLG